MVTLLHLPENLMQIATLIQNGNTEGLTQMMAEFNENVNAILTTEGHSAIHLAILGGHAGCVTVSIVAGIVCIKNVDIGEERFTYVSPSAAELPSKIFILWALTWHVT
ncbi:Pre-mRNA cleavage complex subunit Clp1 C-terminal [Arabidopsis suecica]|uniref:Pre-mRNA cleavage complex subunit Clp1 C-terminal n=1 Tax=Arabidopsis suecica TaxID=45249 RepID=A0A8T2DGR1_ARASU|nr:Pre-mRNA cleavage complex subunit Clp1 C-terminal [Arabidopsis suecica]